MPFRGSHTFEIVFREHDRADDVRRELAKALPLVRAAGEFVRALTDGDSRAVGHDLDRARPVLDVEKRMLTIELAPAACACSTMRSSASVRDSLSRAV
jgi:hypothetical protein